MTASLARHAATAGTWPASLELRVNRRGAASRLARCRHSGPLYVQRAFYPEGDDLAHLYLLHPPGGIVSGDELCVSVTCDDGARTLLTTPGAARMYRARDTLPRQSQRVRLELREGASLEWFPLETIVFDGACVDMTTDINLAAGSRFIGWEVTCFGLPAAGVPFARGSFRQRYRLCRDGEPLFVDALDVDARHRAALLDGPAALRGQPVSGFFLAGPFADALPEELREALRAACEGMHAALTCTGPMVVGRYLGGSAEAARRQFTRWWQLLRPALLGREACAPRIWLT